MKRNVIALMLTTLLLLSVYWSSVPSISADYTVENPYMPLSVGDVGDLGSKVGLMPVFFAFDGKVDAFDMALFLSCYRGEAPPEAMYLGDLGSQVNGVPTFGRFDGVVDAWDLALWVECQKSGKRVDPPVAYSTSFEFTVPYDGNEGVWYYLLARVYLPQSLDNKSFSLVGNADDAVRNVKMDSKLVFPYETTGPFDVSLGSLRWRYHMLEFEYGESTGSGILNFTVKASTGEYARLSRFRVYVPNYSDTEYRYTVKTLTNFPQSDLYYFSGYADDFLCNFKVDEVPQWDEWQWNTTNQGIIPSWRDGFLYPVFDGKNKGEFPIEFTFVVNASGLLDFQYVSWGQQPDKIGKPKYWSAVELEADPDLTIYKATTHWGSKWDGDPGTSRQFFETTIEVEVNTTSPDLTPFPYKAQFGISVAFPLATDKNSVVDVGLFFNLTDLSTEGGLGVFASPSIEIYAPSQAVLIPPTSLQYADTSETSFISSDMKVVGGFLGTVSGVYLAEKLGAMGFVCFGPVGALGGALAGALIGEGIKLTFDFLAGQTITTLYEIPGNETYRNFYMFPFQNSTQALFARVLPTYPYHCGALELVIDVQIGFMFWWHSSLGVGVPLNAKITLIAPIFVTY